ncbi:MAG: hypothetical protein WEA09_12910 [Gemmatimonadota bacterium]
MKRSPIRMESDALLLLKQALAPTAQVRAAQDPIADAVVELKGGARISFALKTWTGSDENRRHGENTVWVVPRAPEGLRERFRGAQESYVDLRGAVFLSFPNLLVDRDGLQPVARSTPSRSFDPFADRSSLVLRTLMEPIHADRVWGVRELAEAAGVGPATASRAVRELERYEVVNVRRSGRESEIRLQDPKALFSLWAGAYEWTRNQSIAVHAPIGDPLRFLKRSKGIFEGHRWALTLQAGASLVAPHATWERIHIYMDATRPIDLLEFARKQEWPMGDDGRLVLLKPYHRDSVWHGARTVDGLPVVSDLQLVLDLWNYPLRGREQAEHLISSQRLLG